MSTGLLLFFVLQALDIIVTILFRHAGVREANPFINALAPHTGLELALFLVKAVAVITGTVWWGIGRSLKKINLAYSFLLAWNVVALALWHHGARYCERCWFS